MAKKSQTPARTARKAGRRHPLATVALLMIGLVGTGGAYALFTTTASAETTAADEQLVDEGAKLFAANCATCHGKSLEGTTEGPTLLGVGEAAVHFQVDTGRMPLAASGPQAEEKPKQFTDEQVKALYTYVGSKAPGPGIPADRITAVFNEFETVGHISRHQKGTGLGMPISKKLMLGIGGDLLLDSTEGTGSSFYIDVPTTRILPEEAYRSRPEHSDDLAA